MDRWFGKIAVVTGASTGIGAAVAVDLVKAGMIVVGLARRPEKILELRRKVPDDVASCLNAYKCDVTIEQDILEAFVWVEKRFGGVDVLINNAGIGVVANLLDEGNTDTLRSVIDTNIMGVCLCTREAFRSMRKKHINGHVVMINSTLGQNLGGVAFNKSFNVYPATKHAITALTESYRQEFMDIGSKTKISSVSPGWVETEILPPEKFAELKASGVPFIRSEDISQAVLYVLSTPPNVEVHELLIKPVGEKYL